MKPSSLKGIRVRSQYDGMGTVEQVTVGSKVSVQVIFDNGLRKSFSLPLAFNSGLLSSDSNSLNKYILSLTQTHNKEKVIDKEPISFQKKNTIPNDDIPSLSTLGLSVPDEYTLTVRNLALLGALDDFYQLYVNVHDFVMKQMADHTKKLFEEAHKKYNGEIFYYFSDSMKSQIRKLFEPILNKHLHLFTNEYNCVSARAYAFNHFFHFYRTNLKFNDFCILVENICFAILYRLKAQQNPLITKETVCQLINTRIQILAELARQKNLLPPSNVYLAHKSETLYVMKSLSVTLCYQQKHSIESTTYAVPLAHRDNSVMLPVHYCTVCHKYFIGDKTLHEYEKCYGELLIAKQRYKVENSSSVDAFNNFNQESLLHQYGYNVRSDGLTESARRNLLVRLLEKKQMTYHEICRTIEQNISLFQGNPQYNQAVTKWKSDLKFIGDYVKSKS